MGKTQTDNIREAVNVGLGRISAGETVVAINMRLDGTIEVISADEFFLPPDEFIEGEASDVTDQKQIAVTLSDGDVERV